MDDSVKIIDLVSGVVTSIGSHGVTLYLSGGCLTINIT